MQNIDIDELSELLEETKSKISHLDDNLEVITTVEKFISRAVDSEYASLWIFDTAKGGLFRERGEGEVERLSMSEQRGVIAKSFLTLQPAIYNYLVSEKEYFPKIDNYDNIKIKSQILLPILDGEKFIAFLIAYSSVKKPKKFDENDHKLLDASKPFLLSIIYKLYPHFKEKDSDNIVFYQNIEEQSADIITHIKDTELLKSMENDKEIDKEKVLQLLANSVHDIRTPANTLYGFLELLEGELEENKNLLPFIKNAKESASFINELTWGDYAK